MEDNEAELGGGGSWHAKRVGGYPLVMYSLSKCSGKIFSLWYAYFFLISI